MRSPRSFAAEMRLQGRALLALSVPWFSTDSLARADHSLELERNKQLSAAPLQVQDDQLADTRLAVRSRLTALRNALLKSFLSMASAVAAAMLGQYFGIGLPVPGSVLAVGSVFCFAWATLGRLGWASQSWKGDSVAERLDHLVFHLMFWFGMYLATLSIL